MRQGPGPSTFEAPVAPAQGAPPSVTELNADDRVPGAPLIMQRTRDALPLLVAPMAGILFASFGQSVLTTALPTVVGELGALRHLPWVVATGLVATAAAIPFYGRLSDQYGRRRLFRAAIITAMAGTLFAGLAQNLPQLLVARFIQGVGVGGTMTMPAAILADIFSARERGRYIGYTVSMHVLASVLGPLIGGVLVDNVSWRLALFAPLPAGVYAVIVSRRVPSRPAPETRVDFTSGGLLAGSIIGLMVAVMVAGAAGWTSMPALGLYAMTAAFFAGYLAHTRTTQDAVIPPSFLRNPTIAVTSTIGLLTGLGMHGSLAFLPVFFQVGLGTSASLSGFLMTPLVLGLILTSIPAGRFITRAGRYRSLALGGTGLMTLGYLGLSQVGTTTPVWMGMLLVGLLGAGLGMSFPVMMIAAQMSVDDRDLGLATATQQLSKSLGAAIGVAGIGGVWNARLASDVAKQIAPSGLSLDAVLSSPQAISALPIATEVAVREAVAAATGGTFLVIGALALITHVVAWRLKEMQT